MHQCVAGMVLRAISLYFLPSTIKYENVHYSSLSSFLTARDGNRRRQVITQDKTHGLNHDIPGLENTHLVCSTLSQPGRLQ